MTDNLVTYNHTVRIVGNGHGVPYTTPGVYRGRSSVRVGRIDALPLMCHGGRLQVTWSIGDLEPTAPRNGMHLAFMLDDKLIASLVRGSDASEYGDQSESIHAVVDCPAGRHVLFARIDNVTGAWGIPYANSNDAVQRGFIAEEVW